MFPVKQRALRGVCCEWDREVSWYRQGWGPGCGRVGGTHGENGELVYNGDV